MEERIERLEEGMTQRRAVESQILDIVQDIDRKQNEILGTVQSVQLHNAILRLVASTMATKEDLAEMERRLAQDTDRLDGKLDQILALLVKPE
jgi:hypothetical protein